MPAYEESPEDLFDPTTDWQELIGDESPASVHMSNDVQEAVIVGRCPANKARSCERYFLGFATADTAEPYRLRRENPQWHPSRPQLRAYDVSVQEFVPLSNADNPNGEPYYYTPFTFDGEKHALYQWARVTVRYRNFQFRFRADSEIPTAEEEWRRHCFVTTEPRVEALTVSGGQSQLTFAESSTTGPPISPNKTPFGAPIATLLSKKGIVVNWYDVPWEYLSEDPDIFTPTKLDAIAGKVNSDTFMDRYEPGTLLAEPYKYTISTWAVVPEDANDPLRKVTLQIPFTFFDPERGGTEPAGAPFTRGHNLMPWGGNGAGTYPGGDGKFYLATRDGTTSGRKLLDESNFSNIFTHVSAPDLA